MTLIDITTPPEDWTARAACTEHDPEVFFPAIDRRTERQAVAVCRTCPVATQCLTYALAHEPDSEHRHGVWGGLTPKQRARFALELGGVGTHPCRHDGCDRRFGNLTGRASHERKCPQREAA